MRPTIRWLKLSLQNRKNDRGRTMGRLTSFTFISLNGFFKGPNEDIGWHRHGGEEAEYSAASLQAENILLFGRLTYDVMASFWPTPMALESLPVVAEGMNKADKIVFSRTMKTATWSNTRVVGGDIAGEVRHMKQTSGKNMTILGSGSIVSQLADAGLIDGFQIMIDPVALAEGMPIFSGIKRKLDLKLTASRTFKSGVLLLDYQPI